MISLSRISHHALRVADVERSAGFYLNVVGIDRTEKTKDGAVYMRRGSEHHCLSLYPLDHDLGYDPGLAGRPGLDHVAYAVKDRAEVDAAAKALWKAEAKILVGPTELDEPGSPYAVRFVDPDGNRIEICADMEEWVGPENPHPAKPIKLGHLNVHTNNIRPALQFYTDVLGFRVADWIADFFVFLRCNPDHHVTALVKGPAPSMNHVGYEVEDMEALKCAADIAWKNGVDSLWGIGRHGPGHNLFLYYPDPAGNVVEIFAELDLIYDDDNYKSRVWAPEEASCVWTHHITEKFIEATQAVGLAANGVR